VPPKVVTVIKERMLFGYGDRADDKGKKTAASPVAAPR
jgi:hypothetical protein